MGKIIGLLKKHGIKNKDRDLWGRICNPSGVKDERETLVTAQAGVPSGLGLG